MRILVTGANGFLGRHVVTQAVERGHQVVAVVRPATNVKFLKWESEKVSVARFDLRNPSGLEEHMEGIDVVLHLAAGVTGDAQDQFVASVVATERLISVIRKASTKRLVLISSFSVYDYSKTHLSLDEASPVLGPEGALYQRDGYAIAKTWQERIMTEAASKNGWDLTVIRPGFIWGPGNEDIAGLGFEIGSLFFRVLGGRRLPLTYVRNAAGAIVVAAETENTSGQVFNLVDSRGESTARYLRELLHWQGKRRFVIPLPYWMGMANAYLATLASYCLFGKGGKLPGILVPYRFAARFKPLRFHDGKIRESLKWVPEVDYQDALDETFRS